MKKLWNRTDQSVWSLSTLDKEGKGNMNICAYVTAISLQPKMMVVSLYHHTKSLQNVQTNQKALLQLLTEEQMSVVRTCGTQSGNAIDKIARLQKSHEIAYHNDLPYFTASAGFMELTFTDFFEVGADHLLGVAKVEKTKNLTDGKILTLSTLREHSIIR